MSSPPHTDDIGDAPHGINRNAGREAHGDNQCERVFRRIPVPFERSVLMP